MVAALECSFYQMNIGVRVNLRRRPLGSQERERERQERIIEPTSLFSSSIFKCIVAEERPVALPENQLHVFVYPKYNKVQTKCLRVNCPNQWTDAA